MMPLLPPSEPVARSHRRHRLDDPEGIYAELDGPRPDPLGMLLANVHPIERACHRVAQVVTLGRGMQAWHGTSRPRLAVMSHNRCEELDSCS